MIAPSGFRALLARGYVGASWTQEERAEAAGLSRRCLSELDRGINRTARKDTAVLLAGALNLPGRSPICSPLAEPAGVPAAYVLAAQGTGRARPGRPCPRR